MPQTKEQEELSISERLLAQAMPDVQFDYLNVTQPSDEGTVSVDNAIADSMLVSSANGNTSVSTTSLDSNSSGARVANYLEVQQTSKAGEQMIQDNQTTATTATGKLVEKTEQSDIKGEAVVAQSKAALDANVAHDSTLEAVVESDADITAANIGKAFQISQEATANDVAMQQRQRQLNEVQSIAETRLANATLNQAGFKADGSKMNPIVSFLSGLTGYSRIEMTNAEKGVSTASAAIQKNDMARETFNKTSTSKHNQLSKSDYNNLITNSNLNRIAKLSAFSPKQQEAKTALMVTEFSMSKESIKQWSDLANSSSGRTAQGARLIESAFNLYYNSQHVKAQTKELTLNNTARTDAIKLWRNAINSEYGSELSLQDVNGLYTMLTTSDLTAEQVKGYATPISGFLAKGIQADELFDTVANSPVSGQGKDAAREVAINLLPREDRAMFDAMNDKSIKEFSALKPVGADGVTKEGLTEVEFNAIEERAFEQWNSQKRSRTEDPVKFLASVAIPIHTDMDTNLKSFHEDNLKGQMYTWRDNKKVPVTLNDAQFDILRLITTDNVMQGTKSNVERVDEIGAKKLLDNLMGLGATSMWDRRGTPAERAGSIYEKMNAGEISPVEIAEAIQVYFSRVIGDQANATTVSGDFGEVANSGDEAKWLITPPRINKKDVNNLTSSGIVPRVTQFRDSSMVTTKYNELIAGREINMLDPEDIALMLIIGNASYMQQSLNDN